MSWIASSWTFGGVGGEVGALWVGGRPHAAAAVPAVSVTAVALPRVNHNPTANRQHPQGKQPPPLPQQKNKETGAHLRLGEQLARLRVPPAHPPAVVAGEQHLVAVDPHHARDAALGAVKREARLVLGDPLRAGAEVDVDDVHLRRDAHEAVGGEREHLLADGEVAGAAGLVHLDLVQLLAGGEVPHADRLVGGGRDQPLRIHAHCTRPDGTVVALIGADASAILRQPEAGIQVLRAGDEQVALPVVLDLCQGTLVPL